MALRPMTLRHHRNERSADDRDLMAGLGKGLAVIECFSDSHRRLTISQAAALTEMSRAAARRCLITLRHLGYVSFDGKFYALTPRVLRLGYAYVAAGELPQLAQPILDALSSDIQESCSASVLDGADIIYIARSAKKRIMAVDLGVGSRLPAYCTSMGRVLLAALDPKEARARIEASPRRRQTPHTRTNVEEIMRAVDQARAQGYCVIDQELEIGLVSLAVPVQDGTGHTVAALNTSMQSARLSAPDMPKRFLARLRAAATRLRPMIKPSEAC